MLGASIIPGCINNVVRPEEESESGGGGEGHAAFLGLSPGSRPPQEEDFFQINLPFFARERLCRGERTEAAATSCATISSQLEQNRRSLCGLLRPLWPRIHSDQTHLSFLSYPFSEARPCSWSETPGKIIHPAKCHKYLANCEILEKKCFLHFRIKFFILSPLNRSGA